MAEMAGPFQLLVDGLSRWWEQVQNIDGGIAAFLFLLAFFNRPLLAYIEKKREQHLGRLPLKVPLLGLAVWIGWHVLAAAQVRITTAEAAVADLSARKPPEPVGGPVDPNPLLTAKIAEQEGSITRLTSEKRDLERDLESARKDIDSLRRQLRQQAAAADDSKRRAAIRQQLATYMDRGRQLLHVYIASDANSEAEKQLNQWYAESLKYINDALGTDYAAQYRQSTSSGMGIAGFPVAKMGMVDGINSRLRHLSAFIERVR